MSSDDYNLELEKLNGYEDSSANPFSFQPAISIFRLFFLPYLNKLPTRKQRGFLLHAGLDPASSPGSEFRRQP